MSIQEQEDQEVRAKMQSIAKHIDGQLPYSWGFILLAFPFGCDARLNYVSNAQRGDVVRAMYDFIESTKQRFGEHVTDTEGAIYDEQIGRLRQRVAYLEGLIVGLVRNDEIGKKRMLEEIKRLVSQWVEPGEGKS